MSKISNFEWGILIGAALILDIFQLVLDSFGGGIFINPPLDIFIGIALQQYFKRRGVKANWKQWISWIGAPALEFFTASIFPLGWVLEVGATMIIDKGEKAAGKIIGAVGPKSHEDDQNEQTA
jgi:hypothetical protein